MKKFHPFFTIGTVGMIVIAVLHIFMAFGLSLTLSHSTFFTMYLLFFTFIILGVILTVKNCTLSLNKKK